MYFKFQISYYLQKNQGTQSLKLADTYSTFEQNILQVQIQEMLATRGIDSNYGIVFNYV